MDRRLRRLADQVNARFEGSLTELDDTKLRHPQTGQQLGRRRTQQHSLLERLVTVELADPWRGLDSWMLHAFTRPTSAVPHLVLEAVKGPDGYTVFADLLPKVDLVADPDQLRDVFTPLDPLLAAGFTAGTALPLTPAHRTLLSPWCLAVATHRLAEWRVAVEAALGYLDHWQSVLETGVASSMTRQALAARDRVHRRSLVDPDLDPMWDVAEGLVGRPALTEIRALLSGE